MNRKLYLSLLLTISMIVSLFPVTSFAESEKVQIKKSFELANAADSISFILEGFDGEFSSVMILPGGKRITSSKSNKVVTDDKPYWTNNYTINPAPKGKYVFEITASKSAYYNLKVNIPLFSDIPNHWAQDSINDFVKKGIVAGYGNGKFGPNELVTGEALVKMSVLALTEEQPNGKRVWKKAFRWKVTNEELSNQLGSQEYSFIANKTDPWAKPYLSAAGDLGVTNNWKSEDFKKSFKRKDVALLVANVMKMVKVNVTKPTTFSDTVNLTDEYKKAIELVSNYSVFGGYPDGTFKPENQVTRAEAVIVISRLIGFLG